MNINVRLVPSSPEAATAVRCVRCKRPVSPHCSAQLCSVPQTHLLLIFSRQEHMLCSLFVFLWTGPRSILLLRLTPLVILCAWSPCTGSGPPAVRRLLRLANLHISARYWIRPRFPLFWLLNSVWRLRFFFAIFTFRRQQHCLGNKVCEQCCNPAEWFMLPDVPFLRFLCLDKQVDILHVLCGAKPAP